MLTDFARTLKVIPLTAWSDLTRQEFLDLLPLTNNPDTDKRDPDSWLAKKGVAVGSSFRRWIMSALNGDFHAAPRGTQVARLVDEYSTVYAWGAAWPAIEGAPHRDVGLYVRPDRRHQGLGERVLTELRRADDRILAPHQVFIHPWNTAGREFFKRALR